MLSTLKGWLRLLSTSLRLGLPGYRVRTNTYASRLLSPNEATAQDWLRAILKVRKEVPEDKLERYDEITAQYIQHLEDDWGIDINKLDLEV